MASKIKQCLARSWLSGREENQKQKPPPRFFPTRPKPLKSNCTGATLCPGSARQGPCQSSQDERAQSGRKSRAAQSGRKGRAAQSGRKSRAAQPGRKTCAVQPGRLGLAGFYLTC